MFVNRKVAFPYNMTSTSSPEIQYGHTNLTH